MYIPPFPHATTCHTTDHQHTVQVARVQVQYLRQWLDEKAPPVQVAEDDITMCLYHNIRRHGIDVYLGMSLVQNGGSYLMY